MPSCALQNTAAGIYVTVHSETSNRLAMHRNHAFAGFMHKIVHESCFYGIMRKTEGVSYVNSWVAEDGNTCYQINEAKSLELLYEWASNWNDVTDFEFIPVISSHEMSEKMKK